MKTVPVAISKPAIYLDKAGVSTGLDKVHLKCEWRDAAVALVQRAGGSELLLSNVTGEGGYIASVDFGSLFSWSKGGTTSPTKKYAAYLGNLLTNKTLVTGFLANLRFQHSHGEAILRCMGVDQLVVEDCVFDQRKAPHNKESVQPRHVRNGAFRRCIFYGSASVGPLQNDPGAGAGYASSLKKYHAYAKKYPTVVLFEDCDFHGQLRVLGNTKVVLRRCKFAGFDYRAIGGKPVIVGGIDRAITAATIISRADGSRLSPTVVTESCDKGPYKSLR